MRLKDLPKFERDVLDAILADDKDRAILQSQIERSEISIELTGVGFYVKFKVDADCPRLDPPNRHFGDVIAEIAGLEYGAGFVVFIKEGYISQLEGFSYDPEPWPETITEYKVKPVPAQG